MCLTPSLVIKVLFLLRCQTLYVMFQLSRAAHQLLGRLHTWSFCPSGERWSEEVEWPGITLKDGPIILSHILACWDDSLSLWLYSYLWLFVDAESHSLWVFCERSFFCFAEHCVLSSFVIIVLRKRELVALHLLFSECQFSVIVLCLFHTVLWVGL